MDREYLPGRNQTEVVYLMNPILFNPKETEFESFGLGVLSDCVSCQVTEERNGVFECEFQYPVSGLHYDLLQNDCLIKTKPNETKEPQLFRIYQISKPLNGIVTCKAEHISYRLNSITVSSFTAGSAAEALVKLKANSAVENPFTFWTDLSTKAQMTVEVPSSCRSLLGGTEGSFLDVYGGEFEWDNYTVKIHKKRGQDNGVVIEYGKNLTDLNQEEAISNLITGVHPYWRSTGTEEEPGELVELDGEKVITVRTDYSYPRIIPLDLSGEFEEKPTSQQLEEKAREYIEKSGILVPSVSLKVSFAPLWQSPEYEKYQLLERVSLCDEVTVRFPKLGVDAKAKVIKTVYDALRERYVSIELGDAKSNFADTIVNNTKELEKVKNEVKGFPELMKGEIDRATDWITNGAGYMVAVKDANGNWKEICSLDVPDLDKALHVWRWNNGGFGYSGTGYNGPYAVAITQDGHIVADFITTGTLTANIIRAGILSSLDGKSYWNLETGELVVSGELKNYGSSGKLGVRIKGPNIEIYNWALNGEKVGQIASVYQQGRNYGAMAIYGEPGCPVHMGVRKDGGGLMSYITLADNDEGPVIVHKAAEFKDKAFFWENVEFNRNVKTHGDVDMEGMVRIWGNRGFTGSVPIAGIRLEFKEGICISAKVE
jgi:phage minor structural protein